MKPLERALDIAVTLTAKLDGPTIATITKMVEGAITNAVREEHERCIAIIQHYLLFDSQRAVSWHEVQDTIKAINKEP
jgi:hypothetical protein